MKYSKPLVLSATFSSGPPFSSRPDDLPKRMVARPLFATYFGMNWTDVKDSLLPSRHGVPKDTLQLITRHYKRTHGLVESAQKSPFQSTWTSSTECPRCTSRRSAAADQNGSIEERPHGVRAYCAIYYDCYA